MRFKRFLDGGVAEDEGFVGGVDGGAEGGEVEVGCWWGGGGGGGAVVEDVVGGETIREGV